MSLTPNTRDEVTLIFLKHKYRENAGIVSNVTISYDVRAAADYENHAIRATFEEVRERNALGKQAGSYEAIAEVCEDFFKCIAAEPAQVG